MHGIINYIVRDQCSQAVEERKKMATEYLTRNKDVDKYRGLNNVDSEKRDRHSFCSNSDLFCLHAAPIAERRLSEDEYKRQAECLKL